MRYEKLNQNVRHGAARASREAESLADSAVDVVTEKAVQRVRSGRSATSDYLHSLSDAAEAAGNSMRTDGYPGSASRLTKAASVISEVGNSISSYDVESVVHETADALRRRPALALSLAAIGGYALFKLAGQSSSASSARRLRS